MDKSVVLVVLVAVLVKQCLGQNLLAAYNNCRAEYNADQETFNAIKNGDFSIRTPLVECLGECVVKKVGFMNDDLSFNKDIIVKFVSRFLKPEHSEDIYTKCTQDVAPVLCATAYEVYQCVYENAVAKWGTRRRG
ncbi:general odorant-binding protein 56d-like [Culex pipiens pallens]|uniref:general odorant-binding protein 56d-like n=1 Tax=Culex pipiens pallens TaxID=42434 RepID=UPI001952B27E|nr:general odorant-binding protein 56d-like [Culex pipiens pallens]